MTKKSKSVFEILTESVGLYFSEFDKFIRYMTFPVLGQILGLGLTLVITYFYSINLPKLLDKYPNLNDIWTIIGITVLITLPGLAIFCKAFWDYLIAYGAINSMFINLKKSKKVYDFEAHNELIKRRSIQFICLWMLFGIFSIVAVCPLFWVICGVFAVYFVLAFQVFTFEPEQSPLGCIKKSLLLVRGHFTQTFILILAAAILTYYLIPTIVIKALDCTGINTALSASIMPLMNLLPEIDLSMYGLGALNHSMYALITVQTIIAQILIQYTLPLRSILWSNWYAELNGGTAEPELPQTTKKSKKRPSEKLMENTKKKFSKKKINDNIIKRAMEKDDEQG